MPRGQMSKAFVPWDLPLLRCLICPYLPSLGDHTDPNLQYVGSSIQVHIWQTPTWFLGKLQHSLRCTPTLSSSQSSPPTSPHMLSFWGRFSLTWSLDTLQRQSASAPLCCGSSALFVAHPKSVKSVCVWWSDPWICMYSFFFLKAKYHRFHSIKLVQSMTNISS